MGVVKVSGRGFAAIKNHHMKVKKICCGAWSEQVGVAVVVRKLILSIKNVFKTAIRESKS